MEVAELCLNHRPKGLHGVYDRAERFDERAAALQRWADRLDRLRAAHGGERALAPLRPASVPTSGPTAL